MGRVRFGATFIKWYAILAIPATILAVLLVVLLDDYITSWINSLSYINWRLVAVEGSARLPELVGMVVGLAIILGILLLERKQVESNS
ncbi:MAG: hypothetical protein P1Q69_17955 [Candidatus Thorarchaeota archaeon]|nr:hypothetical protein [Candidatus Thorarchaeota archaeon]